MMSLDEVITAKEQRDVHVVLVSLPDKDDVIMDKKGDLVSKFDLTRGRKPEKYSLRHPDQVLSEMLLPSMGSVIFWETTGMPHYFHSEIPSIRGFSVIRAKPTSNFFGDSLYKAIVDDYYNHFCRKSAIKFRVLSFDLTECPEGAKRQALQSCERAVIECGIEIVSLNERFGADAEENIDYIREEVTKLLHCDEPFTHNHIYVVLGLSGSGKSTLINHVLRYVEKAAQATKMTTREMRTNIHDKIKVTRPSDSQIWNPARLACLYDAVGNIYGYERDAIAEALDRGEDIVVDTTSLEGAMMLKSAFPQHTRTVLVESDINLVEMQLVKRYTRIPFPTRAEIRRHASGVDSRLKYAIQCLESYSAMQDAADFIIPFDGHFWDRQKALRDYILGQRFPDLIVTGQVAK